MSTYIAILRGINVSGQKLIKMAELKKLIEQLGYSSVQTYIQSGNIVFNSNEKKLAEQISAAILKHFGFDVPVLVLSTEDWRKAKDQQPFLDKEEKALHLTFLAEAPSAENLSALKDMAYPPDEYHIIDKVIYLHCPNGYGNTKLSNTFFERKLKVSATTRNWATVNKLLDMAQSLS